MLLPKFQSLIFPRGSFFLEKALVFGNLVFLERPMLQTRIHEIE